MMMYIPDEIIWKITLVALFKWKNIYNGPSNLLRSAIVKKK